MTHQADNAQYLLAILTEMGQQHTNPVLLSLPEPDKITLKQKYYIEAVLTNQTSLKIFYHCHPYPAKDDQEHGHFHLFLHFNDQADWKHLAALSMNHNGQPIEWLTVNQWVTDSPWADQNDLETLNMDISELEPDDLLQAWFIAMISLYQQELQTLLSKRDKELSKIKSVSADTDILNNREIYSLSHCSINLQSQLESALSETDIS